MPQNTYDRKFDTWKWHNPEVHDRPLEFEIRMRRPENMAQGRITYFINHTDPPVDIAAPTLEDLKQQLDTRLRDWFAVSDWKPMAFVVIEERPLRIAIEVDSYLEGVNRDGSVYHKEKGRGTEWKIGAGRRLVWRDSDDQTAIAVPDTPENQELLVSMGVTLSNVAKALKDALLKAGGELRPHDERARTL